MSSSLSFIWDFCVRHPGILLVFFGVIGEVIFDWKDMGKGGLARCKRLSAILLVLGLAIEIIEASKADRENASLHEKAEQAAKDAGVANARAAEANVQVEILRKENLRLYEQIQPRRISPQNKDLIIGELRKWAFDPQKCKLHISAQGWDAEAKAFAWQISEILANDCGFKVNLDVGINVDATEMRFGLRYFVGSPPPASAKAIANALKNAGIIPNSVETNADIGVFSIWVDAKPFPK